jgi:pimeloyl-ACP methyl ester carboxylesterase
MTRRVEDPMLATIDTGSGPPVVLLHGQPGSKASWAPLIDHLTPQFRVLAPDRPGYGDTGGKAMGMAENSDAVAEFLRLHGAAPATVVGHSWSGGVAVFLALRHPEMVRSLVLVGAVGTPDSVNGLDRLLVVPGIGDILTVAALTGIGVVLPQIRGLAKGMDQRRRAASSRKHVKPEPEPVSAPGPGRDLPRETLTTRIRSSVAVSLPNEMVLGGWRGAWGRDRRTFMHEQRTLLEELSAVTSSLAKIDVPTSVVFGTRDVVVPPHASRSLAAAIPHAELFEIHGVGHFVARDASIRLAEIIAITDRRAESLSTE